MASEDSDGGGDDDAEVDDVDADDDSDDGEQGRPCAVPLFVVIGVSTGVRMAAGSLVAGEAYGIDARWYVVS